MGSIENNKLLFSIVSVVIALVTVFFIFPPDTLLAKKITPYAIHWMLFCFGAGLFFLAIHSNFLLYLSFGCTAILALLLMNSYNTDLKLAINSSSSSFSVVFVNPTLSVDEEDKILDRLILQNSDIIIIEELTPNWLHLLTQELERYPYQLVLPRIDPLGKAILSKFAFINSDTFTLCEIPVLSGTWTTENLDKIVISTCNFLPPITLSSYKKLNCFLDSLSGQLNKPDCHSVLAANFNVIPWSKELREFRDKTKLVSSRRDNNEGVASSNVFGILNAPNNEIYFSHTLECSLFTVIKDSKDNPIGLFGKYQFKNL